MAVVGVVEAAWSQEVYEWRGCFIRFWKSRFVILPVPNHAALKVSSIYLSHSPNQRFQEKSAGSKAERLPSIEDIAMEQRHMRVLSFSANSSKVLVILIVRYEVAICFAM